MTFSLFLFSCQKETPPPTCTITMAGLSGTYKIGAIQYRLTASSAPVDYLALMDACEKDDLLQLKNDGTYIYTDAGMVCSPNGSSTGTWSLSGTVLTSDGLLAGTIEGYDCKTLVCFIDNVNVPGDRVTQTLVRQ